MWDHYEVVIKIRDKLVGGWPKNPESEAAMLRARGLEDLIPPPVDLSILTEEEKELEKTKAIEKTATGFLSNSQGLYIESRQIKAMLREGANVLKAILIDPKTKQAGIKNMKAKFVERVFVEPLEISLGKTEPDGTGTRFIHPMTAQGPRSSVKFFDYVVQPEITFQLKVLQDKVITVEHLQAILEYCQDNALGADRRQEFGKFKLIKFGIIERI